MLHTSAFGLGSVAASWLLKRDGLLAARADEPFKPDLEQKTAYEISACLVGSEMCIRDR